MTAYTPAEQAAIKRHKHRVPLTALSESTALLIAIAMSNAAKTAALRDAAEAVLRMLDFEKHVYRTKIEALRDALKDAQ